MKILIVGENINALLLADFLKIQNPQSDIFITRKDEEKYEFCTAVNIAESNVSGLLEFVKYNQIEFTVVLSELTVINGIADEFQKEGFAVFAPCSQSARVTYFNSIAKKIMYKLKIPTPRFGIFDRENMAVDYVRNTGLPVVVENDFTLIERKSNTFKTFKEAKRGIQMMFESSNEKIVIENFLEGQNIYLYFITDGFSAFPLVNIERSEHEKFTVLRSGSNKISEDMIIKILQSVVYPLLDDIAKFSQPYAGILGLKLKIRKNSFFVYEFYNTFQNYDFQVFLSLLNENILNLLYDTAQGSLADNRDYVEMSADYSYSIAIDKACVKGSVLDEDNLFVTGDNSHIIYTMINSTLNSAAGRLADILEDVVDDKIIKEIKANEIKKELRI